MHKRPSLLLLVGYPMLLEPNRHRMMVEAEFKIDSSVLLAQ